MKNLFKVIIVILIISSGICLLVYNTESIFTITNAINRCITIIFPSLFGFMIVTSFLLESGICNLISKPFIPISKYIFGMDTEIFTVFLFSLIGGYPAGANLVRKLYDSDKITKKQANYYSACFYCGGPAFIFGLYGTTVGKFVYLSIIISNLIIILIVNNLLFRKENEINNKKTKININTKMLINTVNSNFYILSKVCAMIIAFSFFIVPLNHLITDKRVFPFIEISYITEITVAPIFAAMIFSFGGLCVILQVKAILNELLELKVFFIIRLLSSALSGIIMSVFMILIPDKTVMSMTVFNTSETYQYGYTPILFCFMMATLLLYESERKLDR